MGPGPGSGFESQTRAHCDSKILYLLSNALFKIYRHDWGYEDLLKDLSQKDLWYKRTFNQKDLLARGPFPKDLLNQRTFGQKDLFSKGPFVKRTFSQMDLWATT